MVSEPMTVADERLRRKQQLAAALRLVASHGLASGGGAGHITVRDPERSDCFWVNPYGIPFSHLRVSDLLLVNHDGEVLEGSEMLNGAAFAIHKAIHARHPHLHAAAHNHSPNGRPWSATERLVEPTSQDACTFYERQVVFDDFTGVVVDVSEGDRIAEALAEPTSAEGGHRVAILANHGILTVGESVGEAMWWYILYEGLCRDQWLLETAGRPYKTINHDVAVHTRKQNGNRLVAEAQFQILYNEITTTQPDLLN